MVIYIVIICNYCINTKYYNFNALLNVALSCILYNHFSNITKQNFCLASVPGPTRGGCEHSLTSKGGAVMD